MEIITILKTITKCKPRTEIFPGDFLSQLSRTQRRETQPLPHVHGRVDRVTVRRDGQEGQGNPVSLTDVEETRNIG